MIMVAINFFLSTTKDSKFAGNELKCLVHKH